jgi:hypothetical protein
LRKKILRTSRKLFHGLVKVTAPSCKATNPKKTEKLIACHAHTRKETDQYGFTNIRNTVKRGAVEICITLGRMTGRPFRVFLRLPPHRQSDDHCIQDYHMWNTRGCVDFVQY